LATLIDDAADVDSVAALERRVGRIMVSRIDAPGRRVTSLSALLGSGAVTVRHFYARSLQNQIDRFLDTNDVDAIYCSSSPMAEYLYRSRHAATRIARARTIMDLIDVDSRKWEQYAEKSPGWNAWIYRREARCLAAYERRIAERFDHVLVVSEQEKALFPGVQSDALLAIPNGVDLEYFTPDYRSRIETPPMSIVFTGVMDYWPNIEGVGWFVERIFPRIRAAVPDAHLHIVGSRPASAVRRLGTTAGVTVTGYVDDVRDFIAGARVCVAPLRIARGVQNKVLEAMAMGKAVISTPDAFEGLAAVPGRDLEIAGDEERFAAMVIDLLGDSARAQQLGQNARRCVEQGYSWAVSLRPLDAILSGLPATNAARA
jgi:sugar transferase (PEP-CTERM/EpsH1 system associated)